ncbi:MAG: hypothetical protein K5756_00770 [Clostridiales bacterium]|nr:hypothetical protein [Clostridiales bacterium]
MSKLKKVLCVFFSVVFVFSGVSATVSAAGFDGAVSSNAVEKDATHILENVSYSFGPLLLGTSKTRSYTFVPKKTGAYILSLGNRKNCNLNVAIYSDHMDGQFCDGFSLNNAKKLSGLLQLTADVTYTIKFSVDSIWDINCTFEIENVVGKIDNITLVSLPQKSTYIYGVDYSSDLRLDLKGLVISASVPTLMGKKTVEFTHSDFSFSSSSSLEYEHRPPVGKMTVKINTPLGTFDWDIKIINNPISKIEITKLPNKLVYDERTDGELFLIVFFHPEINIDGMEITATYKNGVTEILSKANNFTSQIYSGCGISVFEEDNIEGTTFSNSSTINVSYMGLQRTYSITISRVDLVTKTLLYVKQLINRAITMF